MPTDQAPSRGQAGGGYILSGGGGTGAPTQPGTGVYGGQLYQYVEAIANIFGKHVHPAGSGAMAARGIMQAAEKQARAEARAADLNARAAQVLQLFQQTHPFEMGFVTTAIEDAPPELAAGLVKIGNKLDVLRGKKQTKVRVQKERKLEAKIARRQNKLAPYTQVRVSELRGPNAGFWQERGAPPPLFLTQRSVG